MVAREQKYVVIPNAQETDTAHVFSFTLERSKTARKLHLDFILHMPWFHLGDDLFTRAIFTQVLCPMFPRQKKVCDVFKPNYILFKIHNPR